MNTLWLTNPFALALGRMPLIRRAGDDRLTQWFLTRFPRSGAGF